MLDFNSSFENRQAVKHIIKNLLLLAHSLNFGWCSVYSIWNINIDYFIKTFVLLKLMNELRILFDFLKGINRFMAKWWKYYFFSLAEKFLTIVYFCLNVLAVFSSSFSFISQSTIIFLCNLNSLELN